MSRMKILLVEPMKKPRVVEVEHTLETMRKLVGGAIACTYPWDDLVGLVHADDAIALGYPLNRMLWDESGRVYDVVPGTFFLCGLGAEDFCSLSDELAAKFLERFRYPEAFFRTDTGSVVGIRIGSGEKPRKLL